MQIPTREVKDKMVFFRRKKTTDLRKILRKKERVKSKLAASIAASQAERNARILKEKRKAIQKVSRGSFLERVGKAAGKGAISIGKGLAKGTRSSSKKDFIGIPDMFGSPTVSRTRKKSMKRRKSKKSKRRSKRNSSGKTITIRVG
jgi:hypothetical protein|tara:strand:- start:275 stop:712 length:438 start_codon:yes stop_codon:yes gene_type:complete